jgi:hypothetical protein
MIEIMLPNPTESLRACVRRNPQLWHELQTTPRRINHPDEAYVWSVLRAGNERAKQIADATLDDLRAGMGMAYYPRT